MHVQFQAELNKLGSAVSSCARRGSSELLLSGSHGHFAAEHQTAAAMGGVRLFFLSSAASKQEVGKMGIVLFCKEYKPVPRTLA